MIRKYIYQTCLGNSFDPHIFGSDDLECLFRHYDSLCFRNDFARRANRRLCFSVSPRRAGPLGAFQVSQSELSVEVAPVVIASEFRRNSLKFKLLAGNPCETEGYGLLVILEHIFIHLLIEVFASHNSVGEIADFSRLASHHFSHVQSMTSDPAGSLRSGSPNAGREGLTNRRAETQRDCILSPPRPPVRGPTNFYQLQHNSCYLDTLLMIILGGDATAWREAVFTADVNSTDYSHFLSAFPAAATVERVRSVAYQLQTTLFDDYSSVFSTELRSASRPSLDSSSIRECFASILPDMKIRGVWAPFSASVVYDLLADFFPGLKTQCPVRIIKNGEFDSFKTRPLNLLQMWDYLDPLTDTEGSYEEILWDEIKSPMLVFQNGSLPPIREFDSLQPEIVATPNSGRTTVHKQRAFSEQILDGRYRLGGVVTLVGGGHYIGYILVGGRWHYYNDSGPEFRPLDDLPRGGVWRETGGAKPDLLFYFLIV